jgi:hypothetical protein
MGKEIKADGLIRCDSTDWLAQKVTFGEWTSGSFKPIGESYIIGGDPRPFCPDEKRYRVFVKTCDGCISIMAASSMDYDYVAKLEVVLDSAVDLAIANAIESLGYVEVTDG